MAVSIKEPENNIQISVYPNPANQMLNIVLTNTHIPYFISITDLSGKQILQTTQIEIPVSHLAKGLYLARVEFSNGESAVKKVIIQ